MRSTALRHASDVRGNTNINTSNDYTSNKRQHIQTNTYNYRDNSNY